MAGGWWLGSTYNKDRAAATSPHTYTPIHMYIYTHIQTCLEARGPVDVEAPDVRQRGELPHEVLRLVFWGWWLVLFGAV